MERHKEGLPAPLSDMRRAMAEEMQSCLESDLSVVATMARLAEDWYQRGSQEDGDRVKGEAQRILEQVRRTISTTHLLSMAVKKTLWQSCEALELQLTGTNPK